MRLVGRHEVLESVFVEMDPVLDEFRGVLVELLGAGESCVLLETAAGTGNRLLEFRTRSPHHTHRGASAHDRRMRVAGPLPRRGEEAGLPNKNRAPEI